MVPPACAKPRPIPLALALAGACILALCQATIGRAADPAVPPESGAPPAVGKSAPSPVAAAVAAAEGSQSENLVVPPDSPVGRAIRRLTDAAKETDAAKARDLALGALPVLQNATSGKQPDCLLFALRIEAEIRAGEAANAGESAARGLKAGCDEAAMLQLRAWAAEYAKDGTRRGKGADLASAENDYMRAGELFAARPEGADGAAASLANAAELADLRGDQPACSARALEALALDVDGPTKTRLALIHLGCDTRLEGEDQAVDRLHPYFEGDALTQVLGARLAALRERLDKGHDDPAALTATGFYSLMTGTGAETIWAGRYLGQAAAIDPTLPDLWYLSGRAAEAVSHLDEAKSDYRRQIREHPGHPASHEAANDLANLLATSSPTPAELAEARTLIEQEIARAPRDPDVLDTHGRVLLALGRKPEGIAELEKSLAARPSEELRREIQALRNAR